MNAAFQALNPHTGQPFGPAFAEADSAAVAAAAMAAAEAFAVFAAKTDRQRAELLEDIAGSIEHLGDELIRTAAAETALPPARLLSERGRTTGQLRLFAQLLREGSWVRAIIDTPLPARQPQPRPALCQMQVPLGPVAVFAASNFPLAFSVMGGDAASALAAGCTLVVKAHPAHPQTAELVAGAVRQAVARCGLPAGVFTLLHGRSHQVGLELVQQPAIRAVGFTGSFQGGKALFDAAARRPEPIPVYAEMSSTNPVFLLPGALQQGISPLAEAFAASVTLGVGQFCTNPGVFIVQDNAESQEFIKVLGEKLAAAQAGVMLTPAMAEAYQSGIARQRQHPGTEPLTPPPAAGQPTPHLLKTDVPTMLEYPELTDEVFGPSTIGVVARSEAELLELARSLSGHLTATLYGLPQELARHTELITILSQKAGRLLFNQMPTGVEVCHAMVHGGPFPATTDARSTSVGTEALYRFTRPVCYQNWPDALLPAALQAANPLQLLRKVDGVFIR